MACCFVCGDHRFDFQQISIDLAFLYATSVDLGDIHSKK